MALRVRARMPGDEPPPRPPGWRLGAGGIAAITVWLTVSMLIDAASPSGYRAHYLSELDWQYPTREVTVALGVLYSEAIALIALLRMRGSAPTGARAAMFGILTLFALCLIAPIAMHANSTVGDVLVWHALTMLWLFAYATIRGLLSLARGIQRRIARPF